MKHITAVSQSTMVLLITQDDFVVTRVAESLKAETPLWGHFTLQQVPAFADDVLAKIDIVLLDWQMVQLGEVDIVVLPADLPVLIICHVEDLQEIPTAEQIEICLYDYISTTTLPWIIQKNVQQAALLQKERQQRVFAEALRDISSSLNETLDLDEVLDRILAQVGRVVPYDRVNIMLVEGVYTTPVRMLGYENYLYMLTYRFDLRQESVLRDVLQTKQPMLIPNVQENSKWVRLIPSTCSWMCAPVLIADEVKAFICLDKNTTHFYQQDHLEQLTIFAGQVALAMSKAEQFSSTKRQLDELGALHALALANLEARDEDDLIERGTQIIGQTLYSDNFGVLLLDERKDVLTTHPSYFLNNEEIQHLIIPVSEGVVGYVARTGRPYNSPDVTKDENYVLGSRRTRSEICVPLYHNEEVIGVINAESQELDAFSDADKRLMMTLSNQLSVGIQRMRLFALERQRRRQAETLRMAALTLNATLDVDALLNKLLEFASQFVIFDSANVMLANEQDQLEIKAIRGYEGRDLDAVFAYTFDIWHTPTFKRLYETKKPYLIQDTHASPDWEILPEVAKIRSWLGVPLVVGDEVIGCYSLDKLEVNGFSDEDVRLVEALGSQTAVSLQNIQLLQTTQLAVQESHIVNAISQALNAAPNITENFPKLSHSLQELTDCQFMSLFLFNDDKETGILMALDEPLVAERMSRQVIKVDESSAGATILQGEVHFTPDLSQEVEGYPLTQMLYALGVRSRLNVPLKLGNKVVGSLNIGWSYNNGYKLRHVPLLTQIAHTIAQTLERSRLFDEIKRWTHYWTILHEFSRKITAEVEIETLCQTAVSYLTQKLNYLGASIFLADPEQAVVHLQAISGENAHHIPTGNYQQKFGEGLIGLAAQTNQIVHAPDTSKHPNFLPSKRITIRSEVAFPLRSGDKLIGILDMNSDERNAFNEEDIAILTIVSDQLATALGKVLLFAETRKRATEIEQRNQELIALNEVGKKLAATLDILDIHHVMYNEIVGKIFQVSSFVVGHYNPQHEELICVYAIRDEREIPCSHFPPIPLTKATQTRLTNVRQAQIVDFELEYDLFAQTSWHDFVQGNEEIKSTVYAPLVIGGRLLGMMFLHASEHDAFNDTDLTLITTLANQASIAIENAKLFIEMNQRTAELEALFNLSTSLRVANGLHEMFTLVLQKVLQITGGIVSSIYLIDQATGVWVAVGYYPEDVEFQIKENKTKPTIIEHVMHSAEVYIAQDVMADSIVDFYIDESSVVAHLKSSIHLPLRTKDSVVGVLNIGLIEQRPIPDDEIRLLTAVSEIAGSAIQRTLIVDTLEQHVIERTSELAEANERLKDLDRLKSKFVADVSHELRTPITNISLYLDLIAQGNPAKQERYLSVLKYQTERLMNLIQDTLNLSRIELGRDKVTFHPFDLNEVVRPVAAAHKPSAEAANLQFVRDFAADLPKMYGERNQIAQVVANLLANAINYTKSGSVRLRTEWCPEESEIWLTVTDTGIGIPPEEIPHLFDRFYRGRDVSQSTIPGTGLGLAIVKEIVDVHAGKISIESRPGEGTTFIIKLPVHQ